MNNKCQGLARMMFNPFLFLGCEELGICIVFHVEFANVYSFLRVFKGENALIGIQESIDEKVH